MSGPPACYARHDVAHPPFAGPAVLVTACGTSNSRGALAILRRHRPDVVRLGVNSLPAARTSAASLCHRFATVPEGRDPGYRAALGALVERWRPACVIPVHDAEVEALAADPLPETVQWTPPLETVRIARDKARFARHLEAAGLPVIPTVTGDQEAPWPTPWFVKPRVGNGTRGARRIDSPAEAEQLRRADHVLQPFVEGEEATVDLLAGEDGRLVAAVCRWRREVRAGISVVSETFYDSDLRELALRLTDLLPVRGAANFQAIRDPTAGWRIVELNPRLGSGHPLAHAAGVPIVELLLDWSMGTSEPARWYDHRPSVRMSRHQEELFLERRGEAWVPRGDGVPH